MLRPPSNPASVHRNPSISSFFHPVKPINHYATSRRQELPQHTESDWADSRAEDRACSKSRPATTTTPGYPTFALNSSGLGIEARPTKSNDLAATTAEGVAYVAPAKDESDGSSTTDASSRDGSDNDCVTLAITTCKRFHGFLGTVKGLQAG